jgi:hypothetical protein
MKKGGNQQSSEWDHAANITTRWPWCGEGWNTIMGRTILVAGRFGLSR